eukprot:GGOE01009409.1.p1 GENE.GGOE01009409.1~~GGOE01009409.1.p1  ORF type:complete len:306 (+),score=60.30 GGOE01009409.1:66-983(+)
MSTLPTWISKIPIIDAHVHVIDRSVIDYDVVEFKTVPALAKDWSEDMFRKALEGDAAEPALDVKGAVFVEVSAVDAHLAKEAHWVQGQLTQRDSVLKAIVASVAVEKGAAATKEALGTVEGCAIRGVRRLIQDRPQGFCCSESFIEGVREVARHHLPFELCIRAGTRPEQCADVLRLVESVPEATFILDHAGKPDIANHSFAPWAAFITKLAAHPNCYCKISGLVTEADHNCWTAEDLRPFVLHALAAFGYNRCAFGSDWFVCTLAGTPRQWISALCGIVADSSLEERRALFAGTAEKLYRLSCS